jgi:CubicO group peptidase (beta-lactamase class C family)
MTSQTNVRAGSVSKPVLATAVIRLVEQGLLDLDAPVSDYIADLDLEDEYGPASTVGQLLNHIGGYEDAVVLSHAPIQRQDTTSSLTISSACLLASPS